MCVVVGIDYTKTAFVDKVKPIKTETQLSIASHHYHGQGNVSPMETSMQNKVRNTINMSCQKNDSQNKEGTN